MKARVPTNWFTFIVCIGILLILSAMAGIGYDSMTSRSAAFGMLMFLLLATCVKDWITDYRLNRVLDDFDKDKKEKATK